jgi:hypothetical protein
MGNENEKEGGGGLFEQSEKGAYEELKDNMENCCKCSWKVRIIGWIICFAVGWLLSFFTTVVFIINHNTTQFAILYSVGQVLNILG